MAPQICREIYATLQGIFEVTENVFINLASSFGGGHKSPYADAAYGKKVLITGGTSGVGQVTAQALVNRGAHVIITSRSEERGKAAADRMLQLADGSPSKGSVRIHHVHQRAAITQVTPQVVLQLSYFQVKFMKLDLACMRDVHRFADQVSKMVDLDVLVCNAGIMCPLKHTLTDDGFEVQFQVHLNAGKTDACLPSK
jgi:NAD(P)-dependent dehydrogenase (short-subunit alcohol dehydrogenase family)